MLAYAARRLVALPFLLLGIVSIAFLITHLISSDPLVSIIGERQLSNPEVVAAAKQRWGLDKTLPEQYVQYVARLARGDLGTSFRTKQSVATDLRERIPATVELALAALLVGGVGGVGLGVLAAARRNRWPDHSARVFSLLGSSFPVFWLGLLLLYVFFVRLGWFPGPGRLPPRVAPPTDRTGLHTIDALLDGNASLAWQALRRLMLPAFVLGWGIMGIVSRLVRAAMLDELGSDYVRTARAKGLRERTVLRRHALRNAWLPTLTILGFTFGQLLTSAVLTETIFSWNGIGSYAATATVQLDYPAINGVALFGGVVFALTNLVTDLLYAVADPKLRLR